MKSIAVLMTCHNRKVITLNSLRALFKCKIPDNYLIDVFLVDDGSTDGTEKSVNIEFPQVKVIKGNGNLYWCGGMRLAWEIAGKGDYDSYLWLNDDTNLFTDSIDTLISTSIYLNNLESNDNIIVGSCIDPETGIHSYGGCMFKNMKLISPMEFPQECEMIHGNIVLVSSTIFKSLGNLSPEFIHNSGDNDYGLRALKHGFKVWIAPGFQGTCKMNTLNSIWADENTSLRIRLKLLNSPKGQSFKETYIFAKRHKGLLWPLDLIKLTLLVLCPKIYKLTKLNYNRVSNLNKI